MQLLVLPRTAKNGIRVNAVVPEGVKTSIEANFKSKLASEHLAPVFQAIATHVDKNFYKLK